MPRPINPEKYKYTKEQWKIKREYNRLIKLSGIKDRPEEEVLQMARDLSFKKDVEAEFSCQFVDPKEREIATQLALKYLSDYTIETISDRTNLKEVIRLEVIQERLHEKMEDMYKDNAKAVSLQILDAIHKNTDAIIRIKTSLGLTNKNQKTGYDALTELIKRHKAWREENQLSRHLKCPHCQDFIWLKMRVEAWEARKHPFFKDNMVYNKVLFEKYYNQPVIVNDGFIAEVLEVSKDFPVWVVEKVKGVHPDALKPSIHPKEELIQPPPIKTPRVKKKKKEIPKEEILPSGLSKEMFT